MLKSFILIKCLRISIEMEIYFCLFCLNKIIAEGIGVETNFKFLRQLFKHVEKTFFSQNFENHYCGARTFLYHIKIDATEYKNTLKL